MSDLPEPHDSAAWRERLFAETDRAARRKLVREWARRAGAFPSAQGDPDLLQLPPGLPADVLGVLHAHHLLCGGAGILLPVDWP